MSESKENTNNNYGKEWMWWYSRCFTSAFLSYALNHSIWWSILHFFCGWIYVIYAILFRFHDIKELFK